MAGSLPSHHPTPLRADGEEMPSAPNLGSGHLPPNFVKLGHIQSTLRINIHVYMPNIYIYMYQIFVVCNVHVPHIHMHISLHINTSTSIRP